MKSISRINLSIVFICALFVTIISIMTIKTYAAEDYVLGDVNGDDFVDDRDAIQLLRHTLFPSIFQINQPYDFNGDGKEDSADAIWLLNHTVSPSEYKLNNPARYIVTWKNYDGTVLEIDTDVPHGSMPIYNGTDPSKPATSQYSYTFNGWSPVVSDVTDDVVYIAQYNSIVNKYTVTWKNYDGTVLKIDTDILYGTEPSYDGITPTREGTDQVSYTFKGWTPAMSVVSGDTVYTAQFEEGVRTYTITWKNYDGTVLKTDNIKYNNMPSYSGTTPQRESDATYRYSFTGWSPKIEKAARDVSYLAQFSQSARTSFTIRYDANGGSNAPSSQTKSKGSSIILSSSVPRNGDHVFMGWACGNDGKIYSAGSSFSIDADATLYAVWGHICENCNGVGSVLNSTTCSNCSGSGTVKTYTSNWVDCSSCKGKGTITVTSTGVCPSCSGWGGRVLCECSCGMKWWADQTGSRKCSRCGRIVVGQRQTTCVTCNGSGTTKQSKTSTCSTCDGSGGRYVSSSHTSTCSSCSGTGTKTVRTDCSSCNGKKQIKDFNPTYSVTLYSDGYTYGSASVTQNSPYKLSVPTRSGYEFIGWFDAESDGTQYTNEIGVSLSAWNSTSGNTLYAHWSQKYYTISYDCDAYVNLENLPTVYTVDDSNIALPVQKRDNYDFRWEVDGQSESIISTTYAKNIVVKGVWTPVEYTISYFLNGGSATNKISYNVETSTFELTIPTKTGYMFTGWTGSNGDIPQTDVTIAKGTHGDLSFTANWKINQYTITFNSNGGSSVAPITQDYNTIVQMPDVPSQSNKSFVGWFDVSLQNEYSFDIMPAENITLYAKWVDYQVILSADEKKYISIEDALTPQLFNATAIDSDGNDVSIRVVINDGTQTAEDTLILTLIAEGLYDVKEEKRYTLTVLDVNQSIIYLYTNGVCIGTKKVYDNQRFSLGCETGYDTVWYLNEKPITDNTGNSLTVWNKESGGYDVFSYLTPITFNITYDLNGGINSDTNPIAYNVESNSIALSSPQKTGYTFTGWSGTEIESVEKLVTIPKGSTGDRKYTANWQINTYTITYVLNDGTVPDDANPVEYTYEDDITLVEPTREFYRFLGWYLGENKVDSIHQYYDYNLTLVAKWEYVLIISDNSVIGLTDYGKSITKIIIPSSFEGTVITSIASSAFRDCPNLEEIVISDSIVSIGEFAFQNCTKLNTISISKNVETIGLGALQGCYNLTSMEFPITPVYFGSIFGANEYSENLNYVPASLSTVVITGGTSIIDYAFYNCRNITNITIPNTVTTIGQYAFQDCTGITNFVIPKSVLNIAAGAFQNCENLAIVTLEDGVQTIGNKAFKGTKIESITIPNSVTSIKSDAFANCSFLTIVNYTGTVSEWCNISFGRSWLSQNTDFYFNDSMLTVLEIPMDVTDIPMFAFNFCNSVTSVTIPSSVNTIGMGAFKCCSRLESLTVPYVGKSSSATAYEAVLGYIFDYTTYVSGSFQQASKTTESTEFVDAKTVQSVNEATWQYSCFNRKVTENKYVLGTYFYFIPSSLKSVTITGSKVSDYAFFNCVGLESITLNDTVTSIGTDAFKNCNAAIIYL